MNPRNTSLVNILKLINVILYYTNKRKKKHYIISANEEVALNKSQYLVCCDLKNQLG